MIDGDSASCAELFALLSSLSGYPIDQGIAVTGSIEEFDTRYVDALAPGGRLFVVVGKAPAMQARLITRTGDSDWTSETLFETALKPLVHGTPPPRFAF